MDRPGDELFSRARLSGDQHRGLGRRAACDGPLQLVECRRVADHAVLISEGQPQIAVFPAQLSLLQGVAQDQQDPLALERLFHEIERAELGRLDRGADRAVARDHHHRQLGLALAELGQHLETVHPRHLDIEEHRVRLQDFDALQRFGAGCRLLEHESLVLKDSLERGPDVLLVIDDENAGLAHKARQRGQVSHCVIRCHRMTQCET